MKTANIKLKANIVNIYNSGIIQQIFTMVTYTITIVYNIYYIYFSYVRFDLFCIHFLIIFIDI